LTELVHNAGCASKIAPIDLDAVLGRLPEVKEAQVFGETLHLLVEDIERDLPRLRAALKAEGFAEAHLRPITPSLEDVFVTLLRGQSRGSLSQH
jgi:hypothetical protein